MDQKTETKKKKALRAELREKTTGYILTALGLVAGLAWNDAIGSAIKFFFPQDADSNGIVAKFIYAVIITIVIVIISTSLLRVLGPKEE